jgi:hypothetical protein|nr:MAG TPA: hypothetical protein [Caudoviricetes sp.]
MSGSLKSQGWNEVKKFVTDKFQNIERTVEFTFLIVGEKGIAHGRTNGSYKDRTGNLRNSIGYALYKDGVELEKSTRNKQADDALRDYSSDAGKGYTLIVVAGMPYAQAVEAKGYIVLSSTETFIEDEIRNEVDNILKEAGLKK